MLKQSSLRAALALVALTPAGACGPEPPAAPSGLALNASVAAPGATDDAGATYAVIGDMPYGKAKLDSLPQLIALINHDPAVELVIHVGDIKAGSNSDCSDTYLDRKSTRLNSSHI